VPEDGEAVLTAEAARRLGLSAGGEAVARVTRSRGGRTENVEVRLRVAAVLDMRAGSLARVYAPLSFVLDVEAYKEGYAAPARGWAGDTPEPYASFDGAVLVLPEPLPPIVDRGWSSTPALAASRTSPRTGPGTCSVFPRRRVLRSTTCFRRALP
jgi:putative ABC transport system permease protein